MLAAALAFAAAAAAPDSPVAQALDRADATVQQIIDVPREDRTFENTPGRWRPREKQGIPPNNKGVSINKCKKELKTILHIIKAVNLFLLFVQLRFKSLHKG